MRLRVERSLDEQKGSVSGSQRNLGPTDMEVNDKGHRGAIMEYGRWGVSNKKRERTISFLTERRSLTLIIMLV